MRKIRVLIVDDSALVRKLLTEILSADRSIEVVGAAPDPLVAREKIKRLEPDVLTLDIEMPKMDGITFLGNLMRLRPMPVVMISSLTEHGADLTLQALELGAVDFVAKPRIDVAHGIDKQAQEIIDKIKIAATARIGVKTDIGGVVLSETQPKLSADVILNKVMRQRNFKTTEKLIAIGASTGGTEAIKALLSTMPANSPGIVVTQHIPEQFSGPFAKRMNDCSAMNVCEAADRQHILPGHVYVAPGNRHLLVVRDGARYVCQLNDGPRVNRHKPSVDVMFRSVAQNAGANAVGAVLTGMGDDGAVGLKEMLDVGAATVVQDENTSVVWGMPGEAVKLGAAQHILPLQKISSKLQSLCKS